MMMTDTYGAGGAFIQALRTGSTTASRRALDKAKRLKLYFSNVSFVGPNALSDRLVAAARTRRRAVRCRSRGRLRLAGRAELPERHQRRRRRVQQADRRRGRDRRRSRRSRATSTRACSSRACSRTTARSRPTRWSTTFEKLPDLSLGIGATPGFAPTNHQYSKSVWGTSIQPDGSFKNLYFWTDGSAIQFFE